METAPGLHASIALSIQCGELEDGWGCTSSCRPTHSQPDISFGFIRTHTCKFKSPAANNACVVQVSFIKASVWSMIPNLIATPFAHTHQAHDTATEDQLQIREQWLELTRLGQLVATMAAFEDLKNPKTHKNKGKKPLEQERASSVRANLSQQLRKRARRIKVSGHMFSCLTIIERWWGSRICAIECRETRHTNA